MITKRIRVPVSNYVAVGMCVGTAVLLLTRIYVDERERASLHYVGIGSTLNLTPKCREI